MDGTVYLGDKVFGDTHGFLRKLKDTGRDFIFFSNNSSASINDYYKKLKKLGLPHHCGVITTSGEVMIEYLKRNFAKKKVFLCGTKSLKQSFTLNGIKLCEKDADIAVLAFDTEINYKKIKILCDLVRGGVTYLCTHPDINCPVQNGLLPDCGSFIALVEKSTGRLPDKIVGKPYYETVDYILKLKNVDKSQIVFIGDRLETDIKIGVDNGITGVLMLTGATSEEDSKKSDIKPDFAAKHLMELIELL